MEILDVMWFGGATGTVGIVKVQTDYEGIKYYIGTGAGQDDVYDTERIADWGSTFSKDAGDILFGADELRNGKAVPVPMNKEQAELMIRVGSLYLDIK